MTAEACQAEYDDLRRRSHDPRDVAELLNRHGREFDQGLLRDYVSQAFRACQEVPSFATGALLPLIWSHHIDPVGENRNRYFDVGCRFFLGDDELDALRPLAGRFGFNSFEGALRSYDRLLRDHDWLGHEPSTVGQLAEQQGMLIAELAAESGRDRYPRIGLWLGPAPHKVLLIRREPSDWSSPEADTIVQPLGDVVSRSIRRLARDQFLTLDELAGFQDDDWGSLLVGRGIHQRLASSGDYRVMHINSGLYLLSCEVAG